jgi:hypothetical protein
MKGKKGIKHSSGTRAEKFSQVRTFNRNGMTEWNVKAPFMNVEGAANHYVSLSFLGIEDEK